VLRPIWQANRVDFNQRKGFLRIARQANVPILPIGIHGAHYTAPILYRSPKLAILLIQPLFYGLKRWGISLLGALGAALILSLAPLTLPWRLLLAYLWLGSPASLIPILPATITMRIGPPLEPTILFDSNLDEHAQLDNALHIIQAEVQRLVLEGRT
jgi:1-acyl-sn-glycerol-3-phosphate acyltransferase